MIAPPPAPTCTAERRPPFPLGARAQMAAGACACAAASLFVYAVDPSRHAVYPQCILYNTTGIYCAGCGATRAVYALLHGRLLTALHDNLLFVTALPLVACALAPYFWRALRDDAWPAVPIDPRRTVLRTAIIVAIMITFMIIRNLPGAPFDLLRPLP
jgi:hypothetical protein